MKEVDLNFNITCVSCKRQENINGSAWLYCEIFNNQMLLNDGFDETGETMGCTEHVE